MQPEFAIEDERAGPARSEIRIRGSLTLADAVPLWANLCRLEAGAARGQQLDFEMSGVERIDGGAMALLARLRSDLQRRGVRSEFVGAGERVQQVIHLYGGDIGVVRLYARRPLSVLDQLGRATVSFVQEMQRMLGFLGQMVVAGAWIVRSPRSANWRELPSTMERSGADAVPIVFLTNFLVGLAMAFQAAAQLKQFGANILVADLIGISVCRELGPLMTAIVVSGRSGAAFAAGLGVMQVNGEIDALRTMGFRPLGHLVLPRTLALLVVVPMLTLLADVAGILGGLVVGVLNLDLTVRGHLNETAGVVTLWDVSSGLVKSVVFAMAIALIACQQGLATSGGAEGLGRRTTSAVVLTLFVLILADAVLTVLFRAGS